MNSGNMAWLACWKPQPRKTLQFSFFKLNRTSPPNSCALQSFDYQGLFVWFKRRTRQFSIWIDHTSFKLAYIFFLLHFFFQWTNEINFECWDHFIVFAWATHKITSCRTLSLFIKKRVITNINLWWLLFPLISFLFFSFLFLFLFFSFFFFHIRVFQFRLVFAFT